MLTSNSDTGTPPEPVFHSDNLKLDFTAARPVVQPWLGILLGLVCLFMAVTLMDVLSFNGAPSFVVVTLITSGYGLYLIWVSIKSIKNPVSTVSIELFSDHALFPRSMRSLKTKRLDYSDIRALQLFHGLSGLTLIVGTDNDRVALTGGQEADREVFDQCIFEIERRIAFLSQGYAQLQKIRETHERTDQTLGHRPIVTMVAFAVLIGAYLGVDSIGPETQPGDPLHLILTGANVPTLISDGQWYRLVSANLLHGDFLHLVFNLFAIFILGRILENLVGPIRMTLIFLASGLGGSFASYAFGSSFSSVGSSTAVFGLLGALFVLQMRFYTSIPHLFRQSKTWWATILGLNLILPFVVDGIDLLAHVGGFVTGCVLIWLMYRFYDSYDPGIRVTQSTTVAAGVCGLIFLAGTTQAITAAYDDPRLAVVSLTKSALSESAANPILLNGLAWRIAIDPSSDREQLELASEAIARTTLATPNIGAFEDTEATVMYRLGMYDEAVRIQRNVVDREQRPEFTTQLARFLLARQKKVGSPFLRGVTPGDVELSLESGTYRLKIRSRHTGNVTVLALIADGDRIRGLLSCTANTQSADQEILITEHPASGNVMGTEPIIVLVDVMASATPRMEPVWQYWPADPVTLAYP